MDNIREPSCYYNEWDAFTSQWLKNLIANQQLPSGDVDSRSIAEVSGEDVRKYSQCHFFAGIGGWSYALQLAGWPSDWPVWTGSCPCFPAGTIVLTEDGYKPIENVRVGDLVLTHLGRFMPVTAIGSEISSCVTVKGQGHWGLVCTPHHPIYCREDDGYVWCDAERMAGKRWLTITNIPQIPVPPLTPKTKGYCYDKQIRKWRARGEKCGKNVYIGVYDTESEAVQARSKAVASGIISVRGADGADVTSLGFARFLGYWLGDGWVSGDNIYLCGSRQDGQLLENILLDAGMPGKSYLERTCSRVRCGSKHLAKWLCDNFGKEGHGKRIPVWMHGMSAEYRRAFLDGYQMADGHVETQSNGIGHIRVFTTVSRAVAIGVRVLLNQVGTSASIRKIANSGLAKIEGREVNQRPYYKVIAYESSRSFRFDTQYGCGLVRSVAQSISQRVYNLSVAVDETYTADGIVVHNCQPYSVAGSHKGDKDERNVWPEFRRLIDECRPPVCFGEQVVSPDGRNWLAGVRADLEALGYAVGAADLCAAGVGSPHVRQRLYWVAYSPSAWRCRGGEMEDGGYPQLGGPGTDVRLANLGSQRCLGWQSEQGSGRHATQRSKAECNSGDIDPWGDFDVFVCRDGKRRRAQSGLQLLVNGVSFRLADGRTNKGPVSPGHLLRGLGNAIVPQVAARFIRATISVLCSL